jgi:hypothetical protein
VTIVRVSSPFRRNGLPADKLAFIWDNLLRMAPKFQAGTCAKSCLLLGVLKT